jgi:4-hydroxy-tetrahydrodipicolinate synthase
MEPITELRGIITVLNTPFHADDTLDLDGLRQNVRHALDAGVVGFLVPAMASEVGKLSMAERESMVAAVIDENAGRATIIGGASAPTRQERLTVGRRLLALGCSGILVSLPYENDVQYRAEAEAVAALDPPLLMLQDWDPTGTGVPVPLIAQLFEDIPPFQCLKVEVTPAGPKYSAVLEATSGRLHVSGGWAVMQMIEALDRGVHAFMPTALHRVYTSIHRRYADRNREAARDLFDSVLPILAFSNQHLDISIHFFKRLLHAQGLYATSHVRQPILPFDPHQARIAQELITRAIALEEALTPRSAQ